MFGVLASAHTHMFVCRQLKTRIAELEIQQEQYVAYPVPFFTEAILTPSCPGGLHCSGSVALSLDVSGAVCPPPFIPMFLSSLRPMTFRHAPFAQFTRVSYYGVWICRLGSHMISSPLCLSSLFCLASRPTSARSVSGLGWGSQERRVCVWNCDRD